MAAVPTNPPETEEELMMSIWAPQTTLEQDLRAATGQEYERLIKANDTAISRFEGWQTRQLPEPRDTVVDMYINNLREMNKTAQKSLQPTEHSSRQVIAIKEAVYVFVVFRDH